MQVFDRDSDGYISTTELYQTMEELGLKLSAEDLQEMMREADVNRDGRVDYAGMSPPPPPIKYTRWGGYDVLNQLS